ncbi:MAG: tetratricopeptide repeat protein [Bacteroidales bacterium]|jgi:tetratricopeptide (TPR) repeat protein/4-amino-4-deoxy-L-arabinose transferase-like glycosyltransferase|nr:tetratricopeptide repeat protein [Bacteroidales bacterium]
MNKIKELLNWKGAFCLLAAVSLIVMLILSQQAGISGDEFFHTEHSENVLKYYTDNDTTATAVTPNYNLPYYGQSPDTFSAIVYHVFGIEDIMAVRHFINSFLGWVAILFAALLAKKVGGWRAGLLTMILMLVSPRFIGHSFNNMKDVPFAAATIMTIYYIISFLQNLPTIKKSTAIKLALSLAFALSVRIGGLLLIAFFGLFALVYYIWQYKTLKPYFFKTLCWSLGIVITGYILMVLVWPFAMESPIANVKESFANMSKFATSLRQVFEGKMVWSDSLPYYYTPKFILMTIPSAVIAGIVVSIALLRKNKKQWFYYFVLFFAFVFPVFWIVINKANVYGGWRHSMFVYPAMVACAGLGFDSLIRIIKNKYGKYATAIAFCVLCIHPLAFSIRNHPYEVTYFNELGGGIKNAYGKYELDYYFHSIRQACDWIKANAVKKPDNSKIIVASWLPKPVSYYFRNDTSEFATTFVRYYERGDTDWDYAIFVTTGINPEQLRNGSYPPKNTVHRIEVDGVPICVVLKREDKNDYLAKLELDKGNIPAAIELNKKALRYDNRNESAAYSLAQIYLQQNLPDSSLAILNSILEYNPLSDRINYLKAYCLLLKDQPNEAIALCDKLIANNPKNNTAYSLAANIKLRQQPPDLAGAEGYLMGLISTERFDNSTLEQLISIYRAYGLDERNAAVKLYSVLEKHFRDKGDEETADMYEGYIRRAYGGN